MQTIQTATPGATVEPISAHNGLVMWEGRALGTVTIQADPGTNYLAWMGNGAHGYPFASLEDAVAAVVSNEVRGYWTGEVTR